MSVLNRLPGMSVLRAFEATVRTGSVSAAAKELSLTDGAVSRAIKELEKQIGAPLFERRGRALFPVPQALILAREIARSLEMTYMAIEETKQSFRMRPWVLSCEPTFLIRWLIPRINSLQHMLGKENEIQLVSAGGPVNFAREGIDFAIRRNDFITEDNVTQASFMAERVGPVCRKEVAELCFQNKEIKGTLLHTATRPAAWQDWERATGVTIQHASDFRFEHFYQSLQAAVSGAGIAIGPLALVADDIASGVLVAPRGFIEDGSEYVLMTPAGKENHPVFKALLEWLHNTARKTELIANLH